MFKKNFYSYIYTEIEPQKLVCIITFLQFVIYENQLPIPITLSIKNIVWQQEKVVIFLFYTINFQNYK